MVQMAEAALADEWVINGDRIALQRRVLRLGKPPRRWKRPSWAAVAMREPLEVVNICHAMQYLSCSATSITHHRFVLTFDIILTSRQVMQCSSRQSHAKCSSAQLSIDTVH